MASSRDVSRFLSSGLWAELLVGFVDEGQDDTILLLVVLVVLVVLVLLLVLVLVLVLLVLVRPLSGAPDGRANAAVAVAERVGSSLACERRAELVRRAAFGFSSSGRSACVLSARSLPDG
jgi:hypothetical protein